MDPTEVRRRAEAAARIEQEVTTNRQVEAARKKAQAWERDMRRAFKGIFPRGERLRALTRIGAKLQEGLEAWDVPTWDTSNPKGHPHTRQDNPRKRRGPGKGGKTSKRR